LIDTFKTGCAAGGDPHYEVTLRVAMTDHMPCQASIEIRPGMQAEVERQTGEKTVLQYLRKPLYKSREAVRETQNDFRKIHVCDFSAKNLARLRRPARSSPGRH
jgi:hypothetical protein